MKTIDRVMLYATVVGVAYCCWTLHRPIVLTPVRIESEIKQIEVLTEGVITI